MGGPGMGGPVMGGQGMGGGPGMGGPGMGAPGMGGPPPVMMGSMPTMGGQPPQSLPPLRVKLQGKEHGYYSNMLSQAAPQDSSKVGGKEAVMFFKRSGLPVDKLKDIWKIAAKTSNEHLTKDEFYVALRLIAY